MADCGEARLVVEQEHCEGPDGLDYCTGTLWLTVAKPDGLVVEQEHCEGPGHWFPPAVGSVSARLLLTPGSCSTPARREILKEALLLI